MPGARSVMVSLEAMLWDNLCVVLQVTHQEDDGEERVSGLDQEFLCVPGLDPEASTADCVFMQCECLGERFHGGLLSSEDQRSVGRRPTGTTQVSARVPPALPQPYKGPPWSQGSNLPGEVVNDASHSYR